MKFQSLISSASVILFAAALTLTSCTKDANIIPDLTSSNLAEVTLNVEDIVVGIWTAKTFSNTTGITFNNGSGTADKGGLFSIEVDGTEYSDFTWRILPASVNKDKQTLQLSYGTSAAMKRDYNVQSFSADQIALSSGAGSILLRK